MLRTHFYSNPSLSSDEADQLDNAEHIPDPFTGNPAVEDSGTSPSETSAQANHGNHDALQPSICYPLKAVEGTENVQFFLEDPMDGNEYVSIQVHDETHYFQITSYPGRTSKEVLWRCFHCTEEKMPILPTPFKASIHIQAVHYKIPPVPRSHSRRHVP